MSSEVIYSQNKQLAFFYLDPQINIQKDPLLEVSVYTTFILHYHYPVIYYDEIYKHFRNCLDEKVVPGNIRILYKKKQLVHEYPIGLFLEENTQNSPLQFIISTDMSVKVPEAFRVIKNSWKKAYQVINYNRRCDHIKARISEKEIKELFKNYCIGKTHNLHKETLYEGTHVIVRGIINENIIERKFAIEEYETVESIAKQVFKVPQLWQEEYPKIYSHGQIIPYDMKSKFFLDEWNYNDGYCYLLLKTK